MAGMELGEANDRVFETSGSKHAGGAFGLLTDDRLTRRLVKRGSALEEVSWEEALSYAGKNLAKARDDHGPEGIAFLSSCRCTNEENFLMQKIARTAGQTNNIDQCATTCHAPTVAGLATAFGSAHTSSVGRYRSVLDDTQVAAIEAESGELLADLGYR